MTTRFFKTPQALQKWFEKNHDRCTEQWIGFYKKGSGRPSITWPESVDEALCVGWIDGLRKSIDDESYKIRFTPRRARSHWSAVNVARVAVLQKEGRMRAAGLAAFERRQVANSAQAAYEQGKLEWTPQYLAELKKNKLAWADFQQRRPSYQKQCMWWVMSAKRESTRERRLLTLIESSAAGELIPPLKGQK